MNNRRRGWFKSAVSSGPDPDAFIFTVLLNASDSFTIPTHNAGGAGALTHNFVVDWGDGTSDVITVWNQAQRTHNYTGLPAGEYTITITGLCPSFSFQSTSTSRLKMRKVIQFGNVGFQRIAGMFDTCSNLNAIPTLGPTLVASQPLTRMFANCSLVTHVDAGFFQNCGLATGIREMFQSSGIVGIAPGLYDYFVNVTDAAFVYSFRGNNINSVPAGLFDNMTACTTFQGFFRNCGLVSVPADLFRFNTLVTSFANLFENNASLASVPVDLFRYNTLVTSFSGCFTSCVSLTSIPIDIFRYNTQVTNFSNCFINCDGLTTLPIDLFRYNTLATTFSSCFDQCNNLTLLPTDIFRYNTQVNNFSYLCRGCNSLNNLPADLFRYNTLVTNFESVFQSCNTLTNFPADLFSYNTLVTNFRGAMQGTAISSVPSGFFANNTAATLFGGTSVGLGVFGACPNLATIPSDLFDNCVNATNYGFAFFNCGLLNTSVSALVAGMDMTKVTSTNSMFSGCTLLTGNGQDLIDKPKAAGYTVGTASTTGSYRTFFNCTSLTDFATISANYK